MRSRGLRWELSTAILTEYDDDGFIGVQIDPHGTQPGMTYSELHHAFGFMARPVAPNSEGVGCNLLQAWEGDELHCWLAADPRYIAALPELSEGSSVQYSSRGAFGLLDAEEDTWTKYVPVEFNAAGTPTKAHLIQVGIDGNGKRVINIVHADGFTISMHEDDGIQVRTLDSETFFAIKPGEITMQSQKIMLKGNVYLGAQAELALPLLAGAASPPSPSVFVSSV